MKRLVKRLPEWAALGCLIAFAIASCLTSREGGGSYLKAESDSERVGLPATPADKKVPLTATVVDRSGVTTEITDPSTDFSGFGGLPYNSVGLPVDQKTFTPAGGGEACATYTRWLYFDQIESLSFGKARTATVRLKTGATLSAKQVDSSLLRGKSRDGEFRLPFEKIKSLTFRGTGVKPDVPEEGEPAIVTLRSGEVLRANDVRRYCVIGSPYINVPDSHGNYASVWIKLKRGDATVKKQIRFRQVKEITFEGPAPLKCQFYDVPLCKLSLVDGSMLSGACQGDGSYEEFTFLMGRTDLGPFEVFGSVSAAIQSIAFSR